MHITRQEFDNRLGPWLRLSLAPGMGALRIARLLDAFGSPQAVLDQSHGRLVEVLGSDRLARAVRELPAALQASADQVFSWLSQEHSDGLVRAVWTLHDKDYPASLRHIDDPPPLLYAVGAARWLAPAPDAAPWWGGCAALLAMVGSRQPTPQGALNARQLGEQLARAGVCVVSGLARGIDAAAHQGALLAADDMPTAHPVTVAVMGTGADRIYPAYHRELAQRIAQHGLLLTEQPLGAAPLAAHFPRRNRIITGLSQATLVVEAAEKSGSLVSARLALEQGRDVLAVPGSIHAPQSRGCHRLIQQGAKLVQEVDDALEELTLQPWALRDSGIEAAAATGAGAEVETAAAPAADPDPGVPPRHRALLQALGYDPVSLEQLEQRTGLPTPHLQAQLLELELLQEVARLPGGWFQRTGQG